VIRSLRKRRLRSSGALQYGGRCPKCRVGGVLYWRKRSRNFRCSSRKEVVPDEDLAFPPEEGRAAVEAAWEALRRASARLAAGDEGGGARLGRRRGGVPAARGGGCGPPGPGADGGVPGSVGPGARAAAGGQREGGLAPRPGAHGFRRGAGLAEADERPPRGGRCLRTRKAFAGFTCRPYAHRSYLGTALDLCESRGLVSHSWRRFGMGRSGDIEAIAGPWTASGRMIGWRRHSCCSSRKSAAGARGSSWRSTRRPRGSPGTRRRGGSPRLRTASQPGLGQSSARDSPDEIAPLNRPDPNAIGGEVSGAFACD